MICPKCGKELKDGVNFCSKCGVSFKQTKKKNPVILILILLGIAIAVWVVLFFVLKPSGEEDGDNDDPVVETEDKTQEENGAEDSRDEENKVNVDDIINQQKANTEFPGNTMANLHNGGDVVSDGENVYFYELGCIYKLDNAGNVEQLYTMSDERAASKYSGDSQLQIQDGMLYFKDKYHIVAYDLASGDAKYLMDAVDSFVVDGEYIYYTSKENYNAQSGYLTGAFVIGKYSFAENISVERLVLDEKWENVYIWGKSSVQEGELLVALGEYIFSTEAVWVGYKITIASTDFKSVKEEYDVLRSSYYQMVAAKSYTYILQAPGDNSGYYRVFELPEIISEDDWQNTLDKLDPKYVQYVTDYYKRYDINNLGKNDQEKREELLEDYPIMAEEVIYVLSQKTNNKIKITFEEEFAKAGVTEDLMAKSKEMGGNQPIPKEPAYLQCVNLQTMKEEYNIQEEVFIYHIFGCYENDLIVLANINEVAGVYRITEGSLWESGSNGQALQLQLILEMPIEISDMSRYSMDVYVVGEYLYYRYVGVESRLEGTHASLGGRMQRIALTDTGMLGDESCGEVLTDSIY